MNSFLLIHFFISIFKREIHIALRSPQELLNPILFFIIVISLFPLAITPDPKFLRMLAPGLIWVSALLATLMSLDRLFQADLMNGCLEQFLLMPFPLSLFVLAKVFSHWVLIGLPLVIVSPLLALMLGLAPNSIYPVLLSLLLGTSILSLLGAIGASLTVGLSNRSVLLSLLILPLYIPSLIFGSNCITAAIGGGDYGSDLLFLAAIFILALTLAPFAIAASLKICVNYLE